jgi:FKBP-type peptidyl-prolyl cis-trans isomerase SlyD
MQISEGKAVFIHYTLTNAQGEELDSSKGGEPLGYIHGTGSIIPGLEKALEGKKEGDQFEVTIPPEEAYGERDETLIQKLPRSAFPAEVDLAPGMQFQARSSAGTQIITVTAVEGDEVTVDSNHPLAGESLTFALEVTEVREATDEERLHGHVHGAGGAH